MRIIYSLYHIIHKIIPAPVRQQFRRSLFWLPFFCSWLVGCFLSILRRSHQPSFDLVFVLDELDQKWILGAICREIANHASGKIRFHYGRFYTPRLPFFARPLRLPDAKAYFFADFSFLVRCLKANPSIWFRRKYIWYTHPQEVAPRSEVVFALKQATKVISTCSLFVDGLAREGIEREKLTCVLGAADPDFFRTHQRLPDGLVGFCTAFYERKNPDLILKLVKTLPDRNFILLGRDWKRYPRFSELIESPNFSYVDVPYSEYPRYYEKVSVFVSASVLEGGPIPLIEAMMSNIVPVASRTGFAPDIIEHGRNGFLFDIGSPVELVCELIEKAYALETDIRATVDHLSWKDFSLQMNAILSEPAVGNPR
jgi:glycosyltransferase involved in cell wall biosynthesis